MELVGENEVESEHEKSKVMVVEKKNVLHPSWIMEVMSSFRYLRSCFGKDGEPQKNV